MKIKDYFKGHPSKNSQIRIATKYTYNQMSLHLKSEYGIEIGVRARIEHKELVSVFSEKYNVKGDGHANKLFECYILCKSLKQLKGKPKPRKPKPIKIKDFYDTDEWQLLRRKALRVYGCSCMKCKITNTEMHVDHIKPRSKYPELELDFNNLQVLCRRCNKEKADLNEIDYRPKRLIPLKITI